MGRTGTKAR